MELVPVLAQALDGEVVVHQPTHAPQRAQARVHHFFGSGSGAIGRIHALQQIAGPQGRCERIFDFVSNESEVLAASIAGRWHPRNLFRPAGARKETRTALYRLARLLILKILPPRSSLQRRLRRQGPVLRAQLREAAMLASTLLMLPASRNAAA